METIMLADGRQVKLGRIRPTSRPNILRFSRYIDPATAANIPESVDYYTKAQDAISRMYLNDQYGCCVPPGTCITMADGSIKLVEDIIEGDVVLTAEGNIGSVVGTMSRHVDEDIIRIVCGCDHELRTTWEHPVLTSNGYIKSIELKEGDWLTCKQAKSSIVIRRKLNKIQREKYTGKVYNFEVEGDNSYVANGIGVHNCVISGKAHNVGVWTANESDEALQATDKEILSAYRTICGPADRGCDISVVLNYMKSKGIVMNGQPQKIDGYVAIDWTNADEVKIATYLFGALTLGINLPSAWRDSEDIWDMTNSRIIGGHDVSVVGYKPQGVVISTWGGLRTITWAAFTSQRWIEECYALLAPHWYEKDGISPSGLKVEELKADLEKLKNGTIPDINPHPTPDPTPTPGPKVFTLVKALAAVEQGIDSGGPYAAPDDVVQQIKQNAVKSLVDAWLAN